MNDTKDYLTVEDVAIKFELPEQTIRDWAASGELVAKKIGLRWFFPKYQFEEREPAKIVCIRCGEEITGYRDDQNLEEAKRTNLCQDCIDKDYSAFPS